MRSQMARVKFIPIDWIWIEALGDEYMVEATPLGETEYDIGYFVDPGYDHSIENDQFANHPNAPDWIKNWYGDFMIDVIEYDRSRDE